MHLKPYTLSQGPNAKNTIRDGGSTALNTACTVDTVYTVDTLDTVDMVYAVDMVYTVEMRKMRGIGGMTFIGENSQKKS